MVRNDQLAELVDNSIFEVIPTKSALERAASLPSGASVSVTASPDKGMDATVELATRLTEQGFHVIPHLSARGTKTRAELESIVARLDQAGIRHTFVVGGDATDPGDFPDAMSMLRALADLDHPFDRIGVTGYPEGHPSIADDALMAALVDKLPHAAYIATQMCFDATAIEKWIRTIRAEGVALPVWLGVPGAVGVAKLVTIGARIGVGQSLRYLRKNRRVMTRVARGGVSATDDLVAELSPLAGQLGIAGLHVFTFNAIADTADWWRAVHTGA